MRQGSSRKVLAKTSSRSGRQDLHARPFRGGAQRHYTQHGVPYRGRSAGNQGKRITRDELYICDELFFTGTAAEVTLIRELDRIEIGAGSRGPITEKIQTAFFDIVNGRNRSTRTG